MTEKKKEGAVRGLREADEPVDSWSDPPILTDKKVEAGAEMTKKVQLVFPGVSGLVRGTMPRSEDFDFRSSVITLLSSVANDHRIYPRHAEDFTSLQLTGEPLEGERHLILARGKG